MKPTYRPIRLSLDTSAIEFSLTFPCPICCAAYKTRSREPKCTHLVFGGLDEDVFYMAEYLNKEKLDNSSLHILVDEILTEGFNEPLLVYSFIHRVLSAEELYFAFSYGEWRHGGIEFMNL